MNKLIITMLISSTTIFACSNSSIITQNSKPQTTQSVNPVLVDAQVSPQDISNIEVNMGEEFVIVLDANATTGYEWNIADFDKSYFSIVGNKYETANVSAGSGGKSIWTFKANNKGNSVIVMSYARPWEKDIAPIKTQKFNITVKENVNQSFGLKFLGEIKKRIGF